MFSKISYSMILYFIKFVILINWEMNLDKNIKLFNKLVYALGNYYLPKLKIDEFSFICI